MKNINIITKIIVPIILIGTIVAYIGFLYLNTFVEKTINHEIEQKIENKISYIYNHIESEFKLLFYLYGTSKVDYITQERISKKSILAKLKKYKKDSSDIVYIIDSNKYIKLTKKDLTLGELSTLEKIKQKIIIVDNIKYQINYLHFKPWNWEIIYLLDTSSFEDILAKNKLALLGIIYFLLLVLIILIMVTIKLFIKAPIDILLNHFRAISKGKYNLIENIYNTKEIDKLILDVNSMTKSIQYREDEASTMLELTKINESYMEDILSSQSSIIIINDTKKILDVNDSFLKFFDEFKSLNDFHNKHKCVCEYFVHEDGFIYSSEDKNWVEYLILNPDKLHKVKILKNNTDYIFTIQAKESKRYKRVIITMIDITEFEKSNNLLEQYKKAVDAGSTVSKTDTKGIITYVNDKFIDISGYSKDELIGVNHSIVKSKNTKKETFKEMWKTISSKQIWHGNIENSRKDGVPYFVAATIIPILDGNGKIIEYIALRYDITEQILAVESAKKAENTKSLFLANMSHEIRTPLNAIIGFTKILKRSELEKKESNYINVIDKSAENLLGIVNDILDISKIENGSLVCEKIEFNPFKEFNLIVDLFIAKADESNINIISYIDPKILQKIIGDPLRIKQVLSNLMSNAIKFSKNDSEIVLDIKLTSQDKESCKIRFSVKDSGIGISPDKQKAIFQEFTQADDSTSREYGGTGLGLSISNKIVQTLGSIIEVTSKEGEGSEFYFELQYQITESNNKNLEELNKLNIAIVESENIDNYHYNELKTYLDYLTNLTIYKNCLDIENLNNIDLIIIDETKIDDNMISFNEIRNNKILVLSYEKTKCEELKNATILNIPFNRSVISDFLVSLLNQENISLEIKNENYTQFSGSILVAEDHLVNQQLISMLLELRGISYTIASNGQEAVDLFKLNSYDMILMDINMPIKNGKEATKEIIEYEQIKDIQHTPIVALTSNAIEVDKEETMKIGFDDYLLKPVDEIKLDGVFIKHLAIKKNVVLNKIEQKTEIKEKIKYSLEDTAKNMGLPEIVVKKIVLSFVNTIDEDLDGLELSIKNIDFDSIKNYSHKIKGASLNLRMDNISNLASSIEIQAINNENLSLIQDFSELVDEVKVVQESLK